MIVSDGGLSPLSPNDENNAIVPVQRKQEYSSVSFAKLHSHFTYEPGSEQMSAGRVLWLQ